VITMEMIGKVRRMKLRDHLSNSEIAKRTGLSRNTVKKWLKAPSDEVPKYRRASGQTKLSEFEAALVQALKADAHRPKQARRTARALYARWLQPAHRVYPCLARGTGQGVAGLCAADLCSWRGVSV
jgi:transcriptional regulator with XRE-family HTH domain